MLSKLPIDLSTFRTLRESHYVYVDKTKYAYDIITGGRRFFLSRPRRFGKSLFVSMLKEVLEGNKKLFDGLWIGDSSYAWQKYGVIALDFSVLGINSAQTLQSGLKYSLLNVARQYDLEIDNKPNEPEIILDRVVKALRDRFGFVAILIDEYDNPILHALKDTDRARVIRDGISQFFSAIKGLDAYIDFVFITGITSFAKAGLFSGMNNVRIMTLDPRYAGVCGYNDDEVDAYFIKHIQAWAIKEDIPYKQLRQKIKEWYNGYCFGKDVRSVYNPFSLMNALDKQEFKNFWFQSGAPTFLIEILKKEYLSYDPDYLEVSEDFLGIFDVGATPVVALMFQAGYLTIVGYDREQNSYTLDYPNYEVKTALQKYLLEVFARLDSVAAERISFQLRAALNKENIQEVVVLIEQLFSKVPYQLHVKEEKYYHSLLLMLCAASGIKTHSEYSTSDGRIDLVLELSQKIYLVEVKFNKPVNIALEQIKNREYFKPFFDWNKSVILIGLSFMREPNHFSVVYEAEKLNAS